MNNFYGTPAVVTLAIAFGGAVTGGSFTLLAGYLADKRRARINRQHRITEAANRFYVAIASACREARAARKHKDDEFVYFDEYAPQLTAVHAEAGAALVALLSLVINTSLHPAFDKCLRTYTTVWEVARRGSHESFNAADEAATEALGELAQLESEFSQMRPHEAEMYLKKPGNTDRKWNIHWQN